MQSSRCSRGGRGPSSRRGYGQGEAVILDDSYAELMRIRAPGGRQMDTHELRLTPEGTALFTCYPQTVPTDPLGCWRTRNGQALEAIFQEVDLRTAHLLLEWRSLDHIPVSESYEPLGEPYDYLHLSSIDVAPDGHLLVSAQHACALYKLGRRTGRVIWAQAGLPREHGHSG